MNEVLLKSIYDDVVIFENASPVEKETIANEERVLNEHHRAANERHNNQIQQWGDNLENSSVGEFLRSFDELDGSKPSGGGQGRADYFKTKLSGNTLSLQYQYPACTSWTGDLIKVTFSVSEKGEEKWDMAVLADIRKEPHKEFGDSLDLFTRVPEYVHTEHAHETLAYQAIELYVQTHSQAQTLRGAIISYVEKQQKAAQRQAAAPAAPQA